MSTRSSFTLFLSLVHWIFCNIQLSFLSMWGLQGNITIWRSDVTSTVRLHYVHNNKKNTEIFFSANLVQQQECVGWKGWPWKCSVCWEFLVQVVSYSSKTICMVSCRYHGAGLNSDTWWLAGCQVGSVPGDWLVVRWAQSLVRDALSLGPGV